MRVLILLCLYAFGSVLEADPEVSIEWLDTTDSVFETQTAEIENCGRGEMTFVIGSEVVSNHSIEVSNTIKGSAGLKVPFHGATLNVGAEIERSFKEQFSSGTSEVQEVTVKVPEFSDRHRLRVAIEEVWQNGRMQIVDNPLIGRSKYETYPIRRIRSRRIVDVGKNSPSCLGDEWAVESKQVRLTNFQRVGGGDCEMDTSHNDHVRMEAEYELYLQGDKVTGKITNTIFEGRGSGYGNTTMSDTEVRILFAHRPGWRVVEINKPTYHNTNHVVINKGKTRAGWMKEPEFSFNGTAIESIWYSVDFPGDNDCNLAATMVTLKFQAHWKENKENRY